MLNSTITVVTVTYNAEEFLERTIKSVINQDYKHIEYIIIDGGSSDGTIDIIKKYERYVTYWISEPDDGIYYAMNKGIDVAKGEWINFMNAGDSFCEKDTIIKVLDEIDDNVDLISGDIYYWENEKKKYLKPPGIQNILNGMFCFHQALFVKKSIMKKYKFSTEFKIAGDYDFVLKCYMKKNIFKFLDFPVANFMSGGMAESNVAQAKIEDMFIQSKYLSDCKEVFNLTSYSTLETLKTGNNRLLSTLMGKLYKELEELSLSNKKFVLYGYGNIGEIIYSKYKDNIIEIVDNNYVELNKKHCIIIQDHSILKNLKFDYIFISIMGREKEITEILIEKYCLSEDKILKIAI